MQQLYSIDLADIVVQNRLYTTQPIWRAQCLFVPRFPHFPFIYMRPPISLFNFFRLHFSFIASHRILIHLSNLHHSTPLNTTLIYTTLKYSTLLCSTLLSSTLLHSTLLYSTLLYSTLLYSTLLYSTLLYSTLFTFLQRIQYAVYLFWMLLKITYATSLPASYFLVCPNDGKFLRQININ